jgi:hypothetical protein
MPALFSFTLALINQTWRRLLQPGQPLSYSMVIPATKTVTEISPNDCCFNPSYTKLMPFVGFLTKNAGIFVGVFT